MTSQEKRDRKKENRRLRLEREAAEWKRKQRNQRIMVFGGIAVLVMVGIVLTGYLTDSSDDESATTTLPADTTAPPTTTAAAAEPTCPAFDGSSPMTTVFTAAPPMCIDVTKAYRARVQTSGGELVIDLFADRAPETVNNFVFLSLYHYYDGLPFHRVVGDFVAQTGDRGPDSPGYTIPDELPGDVSEYVPGSVAMANAGPDTGSSQWFVYVGPTPLPGPAYSLFGQVTEGMDTAVTAIMETAPAPEVGDSPSNPATIESITIEET